MSELDSEPVYDVEHEPSDSEDRDIEDIEAPEADAREQHTLVRDDRDDLPSERPVDADEADAADQHRVVELDDEDDYYS